MPCARDLSILSRGLRRVVAKHIASGEQVLFCLKIGNQALVALDNRLLVIFAGLVYGSEVISIEYKDITSVEVKKGLIEADILLTTPSSNHNITLLNLELREFRPYLDHLTQLIHEAKTSSGALSELERLAALYKNGALTDEEFRAAKAKLLSL
jgi:hypothetical protein